MIQRFDPKKYLNTDKNANMNIVSDSIESNRYSSNETLEVVQRIIGALEMKGIDLTSNYEDWLKIGFALADEFGQNGTSLFHRVSKNYPGYEYKACQKQYEHCLKSKRTGVTLGTFFHLAKQAGVDLKRKKNRSLDYTLPTASSNTEEMVVAKKTLATFPDFIFEQIPRLLQDVVVCAKTDTEKDILFLGALTTMSACLPNVYGIYDQYTVYPNLFLFITAPASSGKGRVNLCRRLVQSIHTVKRDTTMADKAQYQIDLAAYRSKKKKDALAIKPSKPPEQMLFIPANNSATGTFQLLAENNGEGLIFETEGDTLAQTFKSEYGNYSDGFRKAFHHEAISYYRRTDSEYIDIPCPKISTVLTGTPDQVLALMPDSENGLFSRFIFYHMKRQKQWRNVFADSKQESLDITFDRLGQQFHRCYNTLCTYSEGIQITLQKEQEDRFHDFFSKQYDKFLFLQKNGLEASLLRLGLICYRIAMILTVLRMSEEGNITNCRTCSDSDFEVALRMITILLAHTEHVFLHLPEPKRVLPRQKNHKERFLDQLPIRFSTQEFKRISDTMNIASKSAERYIKEFIEKGYLQRVAQGEYKNILKKDT
ncbi:DUF3987 domain-containing protein [Aquimarina pacifica]|uniref:DUF3987 domain-containing protein n=1 Tax=Aquimarina pacifica TaxID=1296415 RepID=UPI0004B9D589|nr:DUF3987 domain-containing protein [Aquimarina pacifica]